MQNGHMNNEPEQSRKFWAAEGDANNERSRKWRLRLDPTIRSRFAEFAKQKQTHYPLARRCSVGDHWRSFLPPRSKNGVLHIGIIGNLLLICLDAFHLFLGDVVLQESLSLLCGGAFREQFHMPFMFRDFFKVKADPVFQHGVEAVQVCSFDNEVSDLYEPCDLVFRVLGSERRLPF